MVARRAWDVWERVRRLVVDDGEDMMAFVGGDFGVVVYEGDFWL